MLAATMQKLSVAVATVVFFAQLAFAVDNKKAEYMGGTWGQFEQGTEGRLDVSNEAKALFLPDKKKGNPAEIVYAKVTSLEYGQKTGRRIGLTLVTGAWPLLLSKKRRHYLTIGFSGDDGKPQGVVLELGKDITRGMLTTFETRTGKKVEYETEDARKNIGN
jgi:hypothetical protein